MGQEVAGVVALVLMLGGQWRMVNANFSWRHQEEEEDQLVSALSQAVLSREAAGCSLVLSTDEAVLSRPLQGLLRGEGGRYRPLVSTRLLSFGFSWKDYRGLSGQEQLLNFRTLPPELRSKLWPGGLCAFHLLLQSASCDLAQLVVDLVSKVKVRNTEDKFLLHSRRGVGREEGEGQLFRPPADGIRLKLSSQFLRGSLRLFTVCFYCREGKPLLKEIGTFAADGLLPVGPLFSDTAVNMRGKVLRTCHLYDVDMEAARRLKRQTGMGVELSKEQRVFLEAEALFNVTIQVYPMDIVNEKVEIRYENGTWAGAVGEILANKSDFVMGAFLTEDSVQFLDVSYPMVFFHATFVTRKPLGVVRWQVIFEPFCPLFWAMLVLVVFFSAAAIWLVYGAHRSFVPDVAGRYFLPALNYVVRVLVDQPLPLPTSSPVHIFATFFWIFAIVVTCAYKSKLVAFLTSPPKEFMPRSAQELADASDFRLGMPLLVFLGAKLMVPAANIPAFTTILERSHLVSDVHSCLQSTLKEKYACIGVNMELNYKLTEFIDARGHSLISVAPDKFFNFYISPVFGRGDPYAFTWKKTLQRASEAKLYDKYIRDENLINFFRKLTQIRAVMSQQEKDRQKDDVLTLNKLSAIFRLWYFGVALSLASFATELAR